MSKPDNVTVTAVTVREHKRKRRDEVGEMLASANVLRSPATVYDYAMRYSRMNELTWHLDPSKLRSIIAQSQARLRQPRPAFTVTSKEDGTVYTIDKEVVAGDYAGLLGPKLRPSLRPDGTPGKKGKWQGDVEPIKDKEGAWPDGLDNPIIVELREAAEAAGDLDFIRDDLLKTANLPMGERSRRISDKMKAYAEIVVLKEDNAQLKEDNLQLAGEIKGLKALFHGIDLDSLRAAHPKGPDTDEPGES